MWDGCGDWQVISTNRWLRSSGGGSNQVGVYGSVDRRLAAVLLHEQVGGSVNVEVTNHNRSCCRIVAVYHALEKVILPLDMFAMHYAQEDDHSDNDNDTHEMIGDFPIYGLKWNLVSDPDCPCAVR